MSHYEKECEENMYREFVDWKDWTPKDDTEEDGYQPEYWPEPRMWYRWDWAMEVSPEHSGERTC